MCRFKDSLGQPGVGVHRRVFNIAMFDMLLTVLLSYAVAKWLKQGFVRTLVILFLIGELLHVLFCVETTVVKFVKSILKRLTNCA